MLQDGRRRGPDLARPPRPSSSMSPSECASATSDVDHSPRSPLPEEDRRDLPAAIRRADEARAFLALSASSYLGARSFPEGAWFAAFVAGAAALCYLSAIPLPKEGRGAADAAPTGHEVGGWRHLLLSRKACLLLAYLATWARACGAARFLWAADLDAPRPPPPAAAAIGPSAAEFAPPAGGSQPPPPPGAAPPPAAAAVGRSGPAEGGIRSPASPPVWGASSPGMIDPGGGDHPDATTTWATDLDGATAPRSDPDDATPTRSDSDPPPENGGGGGGGGERSSAVPSAAADREVGGARSDPEEALAAPRAGDVGAAAASVGAEAVAGSRADAPPSVLQAEEGPGGMVETAEAAAGGGKERAALYATARDEANRVDDRKKGPPGASVPDAEVRTRAGAKSAAEAVGAGPSTSRAGGREESVGAQGPGARDGERKATGRETGGGADGDPSAARPDIQGGATRAPGPGPGPWPDGESAATGISPVSDGAGLLVATGSSPARDGAGSPAPRSDSPGDPMAVPEVGAQDRLWPFLSGEIASPSTGAIDDPNDPPRDDERVVASSVADDGMDSLTARGNDFGGPPKMLDLDEADKVRQIPSEDAYSFAQANGFLNNVPEDGETAGVSSVLNGETNSSAQASDPKGPPKLLEADEVDQSQPTSSEESGSPLTRVNDFQKEILKNREGAGTIWVPNGEVDPRTLRARDLRELRGELDVVEDPMPASSRKNKSPVTRVTDFLKKIPHRIRGRVTVEEKAALRARHRNKWMMDALVEAWNSKGLN